VTLFIDAIFFLMPAKDHTMKFQNKAAATLLFLIPVTLFAQVSPTNVNGARNSATDGTSFDTNVSFTLRMSLAGETSARDSAFLGQEVSITATIRPEADDIGEPADIIIVDFLPPSLTMRNSDGNFVTWNGSLRTLQPYLDGVTLEEDLEVEVFSGALGATGNHRIFIGFAVGEVLYFTPTALRFDIGENVREQAIELFNTEISPAIVQFRCITCHVAGGIAQNLSNHTFVRTSNANHLTINFTQIENLHAATSTDYILSKVQGQLLHVGGVQLTAGSTDFQNLQNFLGLLDQL
jgi:hypothetical protein